MIIMLIGECMESLANIIIIITVVVMMMMINDQ